MYGVRQNISAVSKFTKWPPTYVQIGLEQAHQVEIHISEQVPHATLAISPFVVDAKVDSPYPGIHDPCARMCRRWVGHRLRRLSQRTYECDDSNKSKSGANVATGQVRNSWQRRRSGDRGRAPVEERRKEAELCD